MQRDKVFAPAQNRLKRRAAWLATTALTMLTLTPAAQAQSIAANTTPQGGAVVGGAASISQSPGRTLIDQSSARTAIDWQTFNVGSAATVQFVQPDAAAIALNRVVTPDPSIIAGHIDANGQLVLINQSGVVFAKGSQVNAESIFVTTSDIANKDYMAGRLNFSGSPAPGAKIENDGVLTARQAGLVGLVAPQVLNNGVITATLGQVVLAGASAFTLDLYGDRLISLDVTRAVSEVDIGGKLVPGLVTNQGIILADGGKITLTAADADALVTNLIQAGGTIRADSLGGAPGAITLQAVGGNIQIAGNLLARGTAPGATGGAIAAGATGTIAVAPGALADVSGASGGGQIALGAQESAAAVSIAAGATLKADATQQGDGGSVLLDSRNDTAFNGTISVQGGPRGGNGGYADISSDGVISLSGTVLDTATNGKAGEVVLDPLTLVVGTSTPTAAVVTTVVSGNTTVTVGDFGTSTSTSYIDPALLTSLQGTIVLEGVSLVSVASTSALDLVNASLLSIVSSDGSVILSGAVDVEKGGLEIDAGTSISIDAAVSANTFLSLNASGGVTQGTGDSVTAGTLTGNVGTLTLADAGNAIGTLTALTASSGLTLVNSASLAVAGTVKAADITLVLNNAPSGTLGLNGTLSVPTDGAVQIAAEAITLGTGGTILAPAGTIAIAPFNQGALDLGGTSVGGLEISTALRGALDPAAALVFGSAAGFTANTLLAENAISFAGSNVELAASTLVTIAGTLSGNLATGTLDLSGGGLINTGTIDPAVLNFSGSSFISTGSISAGTLTGSVSGGITLTGSDAIGTLSAVTAGGAISLVNAANLDVTGPVNAADITLVLNNTASGTLGLNGALSVSGSGSVQIATDAITLGSGGTIVAPAGTIALAPFNQGALDLGGTSVGGLEISAPLLAALDPAASLILGQAAGFTANTLLAENGIDFGRANVELAGSTLVSIAGGLSGITGTLDLNGGALINTGTIAAPALNVSGTSLVSTGAAAITAGSFTGSLSGGITITGLNTISALGSITAGGDVTLTNSGTLNITGTLFTPGKFSLNNTTGAVTEQADAAIEAQKFLTAGGAIGGTLALIGTGNSIGTLGAVNATGAFSLVNNANLDVTGPVTAPDITLVLNKPASGTLGLNGELSVPGSGSVQIAAEAITLGSGGTIVAHTGTIGGTIAIAPFNQGALDIGGTSVGGLEVSTALLGALDPAATLVLGSADGFTANTLLAENAISFASSNVELTASTLVTIAGTLSGSLSTGTLDLSGATLINSGTIDPTVLNFSGSSFISTGSIAAGTLTGNVSSGITITGGNAIHTLSVITAGGNIVLDNGIALTLGTIIAPTGSFSLTDAAAVTELSNGTLDVAEFDTDGGSIGGALLLDSLGNTIAALGNVSATGNITLANTGTLDLTGTVLTPGTFALDNPTGAVTEQNTAAIQAQRFDAAGATIGGTLALTGTDNLIGTLGGVTASGDFSLQNATILTVADPLQAPDITLLLNGASSSTLDLDSVLSVPTTAGTLFHSIEIAADDIVIGSGGTFSAPAGTIALAPFHPSATFDIGGTTLVSALDASAALIILGSAAGHIADTLTTQGDLDFSAQTLDLTASSIVMQGTISVASSATIALDATNVSELASAGLRAGNLIGNVTIFAALPGTLNAIGTLGNFTAGTLSLFDSAPLAIDGLVSVTSLLTLDDPGSVTEAATGIVDVGTLTTGPFPGSIGGDLILLSPGNDILSASNLNVFGNLEINFGQFGTGTIQVHNLAAGNIILIDDNIVVGEIQAANSLELDMAHTIFLDGTISGTTVDLNSGTGVTEIKDGFETAGGVIDAATLTGDNSISGNISLAGGNEIGTLGNYFVTGANALILNNAGSLTIAGTIDVTAGTLVLTGTGAVNEAAGTIDVAVLTTGTGSIAGNVTLTGDNSIALLSDFTVANGGSLLALNDLAPLTIAGVVDIGATGLFDLTTSADLPDGASVAETGTGAIDAGTFTTDAFVNGALVAGTGGIAGDLLLTGDNTIGIFGDVSASGSIVLDNTPSFTAKTVAGSFILLSTTGSITLDGLITSGSVLALDSGTGISETATGIIDASTLQGTNTSGDVVLTNANSIAVLGGYTLGGGGTVAYDSLIGFATITGSGSLLLTDTVALEIAGNVDVADLFSLTDAAGVFETGAGRITGLGAFTSGDVSEDFVLLTNVNSINLFTGITSSGTIALDNNTQLLYAQHVFGGPSIFIENESGLSGHDLSAGSVALSGGDVFAGGIFADDILISSGTSIVLNNTVDATQAVTLDSETGVTEVSELVGTTPIFGTIVTGTLTGDNATSGDVLLTLANNIGTLGNYFVIGANALILNNAAPLTIAGSIDVTAGTLVLTGTGPVNESGGTINAAILTTGTGSITGNVTLTGTNSIGTLGAFTVSNGGSLFALNDFSSLAIDGTVTAGIFDLTTNPDAPTASVTETGTGAIDAATFTTDAFVNGSLVAGTGSIAGDLFLTLNNSIGIFGDVTAAGSIALVNSPNLTATNVAGSFILLSTTGSITLEGLVSSGSALELDSGAGVSETATGIIDAPTLQGNNTSGDVVLAGANSIATLGNYTLGGTGTLATGVDGLQTISGSGSFLLNDTANLTITGTLDIPEIFSLTSSQSVTESGAGRIDAGQFSGSVANNILLTEPNTITLLSGVTAGGSIAFNNQAPVLDVQEISGGAFITLGSTGALTAHDISAGLVRLSGASVDAGAIAGATIDIGSDTIITLDGPINASIALDLASATGVTETGAGTITTALLTGANTSSGDVSLDGANAIATLGRYTVAGANALILNDIAPLTITGPVDVPDGEFVLTGTAPVDESNGVIDVATLTTGAGSITGNVTLTGANSIGTLGNFAVTGPASLFAFNDGTALTIDGAVQAGIFALTDPDTVQETGAGAITAGTFTGSVGGLLFTGDNAIDTLSRLAANTFITLVNSTALTIAGSITTPVFALDNNAAVTEAAGGIIDATDFNTDGATINGALNLGGVNQIATLGAVAARGGITLANLGPLDLSGIVATAGSFALGNTGAVTETGGGAIHAGEFDGDNVRIAGALSLTNANDIGTLGGVTVGGILRLTDDEALSLLGPVVATQVTLGVNGGPLTLLGSPEGGLFIKGVQDTNSITTAGSLDSVITVSNPGGPGILENGTFYINAGPNAVTYLDNSAQPATLFLNTTHSTGISFATYPQTLDAPSVDLVLNAGPAGTAVGNISVYHLEVIQPASTNLTGTIDGVSGQPASGRATAMPPSSQYRFNACPIGSVNCVLLQLEALPLENPLENFDVAVPKRRRLNAKISLPGIATRDY